MRFDLNITMSKVTAILIVILAFAIDIQAKTGGTVFMFSMPFVNLIVTGKQYFDKKEGGVKCEN